MNKNDSDLEHRVNSNVPFKKDEPRIINIDPNISGDAMLAFFSVTALGAFIGYHEGKEAVLTMQQYSEIRYYLTIAGHSIAGTGIGAVVGIGVGYFVDLLNPK